MCTQPAWDVQYTSASSTSILGKLRRHAAACVTCMAETMRCLLLQEMCRRPSWDSNFPERPMPEEPMLASYIAAQQLLAADMTDGKPAVQTSRSSVNGMHLLTPFL